MGLTRSHDRTLFWHGDCIGPMGELLVSSIQTQSVNLYEYVRGPSYGRLVGLLELERVETLALIYFVLLHGEGKV